MTTTTDSKIPWVEKYKPNHLSEVILSDINQRIFSNVLKTCSFPNVLFYGPPGTGKTTTIINLVKKYHKSLKQKHSALTIHLNASDDRGVDVVRNQLHQFVHTRQLFFPGMKFVILDEVDYMTEFAQQELRILIQTAANTNVRFCLICNYIGKINNGLQNDLVKIRFNQLPVSNMLTFLKNISVSERINLSDSILENIQSQFGSDMRSMINKMQTYQNYSSEQFEIQIINSKVYLHLIRQICETDAPLDEKKCKPIEKQIKKYSTTYCVDEIYIVKKMLELIIWTERENPRYPAFMAFADTIFHNPDSCKYLNKIILEIHRIGQSQ